MSDNKGASKGSVQRDALRAVADDISSMSAEELRAEHESHRHGDIAIALCELSSVPSDAQVTYSYASTQATKCAGCGEHKHTPLRIDWMGGYVCLTCIDKELESRDTADAQDERGAFEANLRSKGATDFGLERWVRYPEQYSDREVQSAWQAWQDRAALQSPAHPTDAALAQPAEPVAWRHSLTCCLYETENEVPLADGDEWAVPLYLGPQTAQITLDETGVIERLAHHIEDKRNTAFSRSTMQDAMTLIGELMQQAQTAQSTPEHSAIYISKRLTGSDMDAPFVQAHINQAVSEAMERSAVVLDDERAGDVK